MWENTDFIGQVSRFTDMWRLYCRTWPRLPKIRLVTQKRVLNAHAEMAVTPHIGKVVY